MAAAELGEEEKLRSEQRRMGLYEMRHSLLHGPAHHLDPIQREPRLFLRPPQHYPSALGVHECLCAASARVLECHHLYRDVLEGLQGYGEW